MKIYLSILILLLFGVSNAQNIGDSIILDSNFKGYKFIYHQEEINAKEVLNILEDNDLAYDEFNASREAFFFGNVFAFIGCGLIIYPFVNSALGSETNYGPAFAGVCFIGISVPIFRSYNKKTVSSIYKYNSDLSNLPQPESSSGFYFGNTQTGIGFKYKF